ncbi:hypothetical protein [Bordetella bronchiseptica]|uniref:Exported protein n=2 Tax=Bordetella bronchiseptica TaxID=518 RepID=A0A0H3LM11_BORBR|nr:hypothetical protein [Bordetella bronchiseptica]SHQ24579.1 Uncharacterised protein [Mycobacteroides abscessus subsp. abscessus]AMG87037.1 hypothetical protein AL472_03810 [Bordetella bronchiseptica]AWP73375.1 hypothetical protein B7P10_02380 [Bordetella bronchiseptica]AWP78186.1 hypothetical protein B7P04_02405 [Bordetella bronchiseptica]AWP83007.1 hypothetical protein B7P00_02395 [Bordetella bronchiseptica]
MKRLKKALARVANACLGVLPPATGGTRPDGHSRHQPGTHAAILSPWRVYRIYARPGRLVLRNDQGRIHDLGVMTGVEPHLAYRLFARGLKGQGFASRTLLLDDIARRIEGGEISDELLALAECTVEPGVDLDRGTHTDVSMKLAR